MKLSNRVLFFAVFCLMTIITSIVTSAQDDTCPTIVQTALANVEDLCSDTARNQACYGSLTLTAKAQPDVVNFAFDTPGDMTNVADIQSLTLSPMDESTGEWGVSLMRLQANLPDTLPGQNVTVLLFGDVEVQPVQALPEIAVTVGSGNSVNVRSGPSTNDSVVGALAAGTTAVANGKNVAGDWLRVRIPDGGLGWVFAELVSGDASMLGVVSADDSAFTPMQAFYFRSGIGDAPCSEAPDSGILIQTPQGAGKIALTINEVNIALGSTAYLQAQPGDVMTVSVLEGQAVISAFDVTQTVPAGSQATVPLDENLAASGPPTETEPYVEEDLQTLPVDALPSGVTVAEPLTETEITAILAEQNQCIVTAPGVVKLRSGPGTLYTLTGSIDPGNSATPTGQAMGLDGYTWYRLTNGSWVRSDVVNTTGDCDQLPVITDIPPTPSPPSPESVTAHIVYLSGICSPNTTVKAGTVTLAMGNARAEWKTCDDVFANVGQIGHATFSGNGPAPFNPHYESFCHPDPNSDGMGTNSMSDVVLEPGVYTYTGTWGYTISCTFTVVP